MKRFLKKTSVVLAAMTLVTALPFSVFAGETEVANFNAKAKSLPKAEAYQMKDYQENKDVLKEANIAYDALEEGDEAQVEAKDLQNYKNLKEKVKGFETSETEFNNVVEKALENIPNVLTEENINKAVTDAKALKSLAETNSSLVNPQMESKINAKLSAVREYVRKDMAKAFTEYTAKLKFANGVNKGQTTLSNAEGLRKYMADLTISFAGSTTPLANVKVSSAALNVAVPYKAGGKYLAELSGKVVGLADLGKEDEIKVASSVTLDAPKLQAPALRYAYVYDGGLIVNIKADAGVKNIYWAYAGERYFNQLPADAGYGKYYRGSGYTNRNDFSSFFKKSAVLDKYTRYDIDDYRLNVKIPSTVDILVEDNMGNKTPIVIKVEKDNIALTKDVPEAVLNALKDVTNFTFKNSEDYKNLLVVEKGTIVDLFETFEKHIVKTLGTFNTRDLEWKSTDLDGNIPYTGVYKFDKEGTFNIQVKDLESGKTVFLTVIVTSGVNNVRSYTIKNKEVRVDKDKFKPIDAMEIATYGNEKPNPISFVALVNGQYVKITDEIEFKDKDGKAVDKLAVKIIDLKENKSFDVTFVKQNIVKNFPDISGHWAESMIKQLAEKGIINGYTDGYFKPNNKITIRETLSILGRFGKRNEALCGKKVANVELFAEKDNQGKANWGYEEVKFAMDRLPRNIFAGKDVTNDPITREEVAYVMSHLYNISGNFNGKDFNDLHSASYIEEVNALSSSNVIKGYPDNTFRPTLEITRAELSSLLFYLPSSFK